MNITSLHPPILRELLICSLKDKGIAKYTQKILDRFNSAKDEITFKALISIRNFKKEYGTFPNYDDFISHLKKDVISNETKEIYDYVLVLKRPIEEWKTTLVDIEARIRAHLIKCGLCNLIQVNGHTSNGLESLKVGLSDMNGLVYDERLKPDNINTNQSVELVSDLNDIINQISSKEKARILRTGIDSFDKDNDEEQRQGGINFGTGTLIFAHTGVGKSFFLRNIALEAICDGYNVMFIQLEGSKIYTYISFIAMLTNTNIYDLMRKAEAKELNHQEINAGMRQFAKDNNIDQYGKLIIKSPTSFSNKTITLEDIEQEIELSEYKLDKKIDVLIIDYIDLMMTHTKVMTPGFFEKHWLSERFVGMAISRDMAFVTATQAVSIEKDVLGLADVALDKGMSQPYSVVLSLNQTREEKEDNIIRIAELKNRHSKIVESIHEITGDRERGYFVRRDDNNTITKHDEPPF